MTLRKKHKSLAEECPEKANLWHPTKNKPLTPKDITVGSDRKVWWFLPYDDPKTGKHFDFEWQTAVNTRIALKSDCPFLSGRVVWPGYNDLASRAPEVAKEWHPSKNGDLTPEKTHYKSNKKVWWRCSNCGHSWSAAIYSRNGNKRGCPVCHNKLNQQGKE